MQCGEMQRCTPHAYLMLSQPDEYWQMCDVDSKLVVIRKLYENR